jgi:hypothetical protein
MRSTVLSPKNDQARFVAKTSFLSSSQVMNSIALIDVIRTLNRHQISFVLVGAHGIAAWTKAPRATEDVDVVVATRHQKKAVRALLASFANLEADDCEVVIRLRDTSTKEVAIDLMKTNQPIYQAAFKNTKPLELEKQKYRIPTLEMALAMKFGPMISLMRADEKKHLDAHDFITMVKVNPEIDLAKLEELGNLVYPGGGKEIVEKVRQVRTGEKLVL